MSLKVGGAEKPPNPGPLATSRTLTSPSGACLRLRNDPLSPCDVFMHHTCAALGSWIKLLLFAVFLIYSNVYQRSRRVNSKATT